ncbi:MAG TPA: CopG family transcriptional regulator [Verrucomicrobiae bacterium]|nr:CopG family transcriptional regulator [Verrucomicrobiae bacterium]
MTTISLKLPDSLLRALTEEARSRRVGKSEVIRDCLERSLRRNRKKARPTCLELMGKAAGSFRGPADLSTNRRHLVKAVKAHADRSGKNPR